MAYQEVTKQQIISGILAAIESLDLPDEEILNEEDAENVIFTAYEAACYTVNPDKQFPPVRM